MLRLLLAVVTTTHERQEQLLSGNLVDNPAVRSIASVRQLQSLCVGPSDMARTANVHIRGRTDRVPGRLRRDVHHEVGKKRPSTILCAAGSAIEDRFFVGRVINGRGPRNIGQGAIARQIRWRAQPEATVASLAPTRETLRRPSSKNDCGYLTAPAFTSGAMKIAGGGKCWWAPASRSAGARTALPSLTSTFRSPRLDRAVATSTVRGGPILADRTRDVHARVNA